MSEVTAEHPVALVHPEDTFGCQLLPSVQGEPLGMGSAGWLARHPHGDTCVTRSAPYPPPWHSHHPVWAGCPSWCWHLPGMWPRAGGDPAGSAGPGAAGTRGAGARVWLRLGSERG